MHVSFFFFSFFFLERECHVHYHSSVARYLFLVVIGNFNGKYSDHVIYLHAGAAEFTRGYLWGSCCPTFSVLGCVVSIIACPFVLCLLGITLFVLLFTVLITTCTLVYSNCSYLFQAENSNAILPIYLKFGPFNVKQQPINQYLNLKINPPSALCVL